VLVRVEARVERVERVPVAQLPLPVPSDLHALVGAVGPLGAALPRRAGQLGDDPRHGDALQRGQLSARMHIQQTTRLRGSTLTVRF
jgi:hypothetical protein